MEIRRSVSSAVSNQAAGQPAEAPERSERQASGAAAPDPSMCSGSAGLAVLVVDDREPLGQALKYRLELEGHRVTVATTGQQALALLADIAFDLLLLDYCLPDTNGLAVAQAARALNPRLFIVLMTGLATSANDRQLLTPDLDAVLPKPWKPHEWQALLANAGKVLAARRSCCQ